MDTKITSGADLAEKFGKYSLNDLRTALNEVVSSEIGKAGMEAMISATPEMTPQQRIAAALWVIMCELLTLDNRRDAVHAAKVDAKDSGDPN